MEATGILKLIASFLFPAGVFSFLVLPYDVMTFVNSSLLSVRFLLSSVPLGWVLCLHSSVKFSSSFIFFAHS